MISVSNNISINPRRISLKFKGTDTSDIVERGDKALNENKTEEALKAYQEAQSKNPDDNLLNKKIAKAYFQMNDYKSAQENYQKFLEKEPENVDVIIELGETQRKQGFYQDAIGNFEKACNLDASNDLAKRSLLTAQNDFLSLYNPTDALIQKNQFAQKNLETALNMASNYKGTEFMSKLRGVTVQFGKTSQMGGTYNIAQYENSKNTITVSDAYIYASPQVIAAYLVHEANHAHDNDAYTSVREEQDAYEDAAKFWLKASKGVKDPEMDYALGLYKKSPESLKKRVEEIYTLRDPSIAKTSPNHPPSKFFNRNSYNSKQAASQSIKQYDIIA